MRLNRYTVFCLLSLGSLISAASCSNKKEQATGGTGGSSFVTDGGTVFDPNSYCNGIFRGQVCDSESRKADIKTVNMLLVIDESGSMNGKSSPTAALTKWQEMKQALAGALTSVEDDINFGLKLFPYASGGLGVTATESCAVPTGPDDVNVDVAPGADNLLAIINTVDQQVPAGGTPTALALNQALAYFSTGKGKDLAGQKYVLLATDGGPNCNASITCEKETCTQNMDLQCADGTPTTTVNCCDASNQANANLSCLDEAAVVSAIGQLAGAGIKTYVIGIPGSEAYEATLNKMAVAGGVVNPSSADPNIQYYSVSAGNSLSDLTRAFEEITTKLVKSCDIELETQPGSGTIVQVAMDCDVVPRLDNADSGASGFYIDYTRTPAHLMLAGSYCDRISQIGAKSLDIIEGCIIPP